MFRFSYLSGSIEHGDRMNIMIQSNFAVFTEDKNSVCQAVVTNAVVIQLLDLDSVFRHIYGKRDLWSI